MFGVSHANPMDEPRVSTWPNSALLVAMSSVQRRENERVHRAVSLGEPRLAFRGNPLLLPRKARPLRRAQPYAGSVYRLNHVPQVERYAVSAELHAKILAFIRPQGPWLSILNERSLEDFRPLAVSLSKSTADVLIWSDWDIIFAYTSYFTGAIQQDHFMQLAADVVQSGLAVVSHYSEGFLIWKSQSIHAEPFDIHRELFVRPRTAEFTFPDGLGAYQMQCALHAAQMRFFEHHYVSPMVAKELLYFRAFLEPCELKTEGKHIRLYPSLTVHQNGVFQMHFRLMSNGNLISTRELIDDFLNSSMTVATDILLPPAQELHLA